MGGVVCGPHACRQPADERRAGGVSRQGSHREMKAAGWNSPVLGKTGRPRMQHAGAADYCETGINARRSAVEEALGLVGQRPRSGNLPAPGPRQREQARLWRRLRKALQSCRSPTSVPRLIQAVRSDAPWRRTRVEFPQRDRAERQLRRGPQAGSTPVPIPAEPSHPFARSCFRAARHHGGIPVHGRVLAEEDQLAASPSSRSQVTPTSRQIRTVLQPGPGGKGWSGCRCRERQRAR